MSTIKVLTKFSIKEVYGQISKFLKMNDSDLMVIANDICNLKSDGISYVIFDTNLRRVVKAKYVGYRKLIDIPFDSLEIDEDLPSIKICETLKFSNRQFDYLYN